MKYPRFCCMVLLLCYPMMNHADVAANKKHEIDYLLGFVRDSGCRLDIHGHNLTGVYASAHLQQQYKLHIKDISTADEFISRTAAQSRVEGKYSLVACQQSTPVRTIDWLQRALNVYRLKRRY